jgi:hypothetical protein
MQPQRSFCWALQDLDACIRSTHHYHQYRIAGLLRLLLFDAHSLAAQVNREHRIRIEFEHLFGTSISLPATEDEHEYQGVRFAFADLQPGIPSSKNALPIRSSQERWSKTGALRVNGRVYSVLEFVKSMAYVQGLTHPGEPSTVEERNLVLIRYKLRTWEMSEINLYLLKQIGRVCMSALEQLFDQARKEHELEFGPYPRFEYEHFPA